MPMARTRAQAQAAPLWLFRPSHYLKKFHVKYTPEAGAIRISVERSAKATELKIVDSGPGVPDEELDRITRRFYRVDGSRRLPGSGLGLSLVQAVATHHGAELTLANGSPGFSVGIAFPLQR